MRRRCDDWSGAMTDRDPATDLGRESLDAWQARAMLSVGM
jgi:hypothetical protein